MGTPDPTTQAVEVRHLYEISRIVTQSTDWNSALDQIVPLLRSIFIFDNLAVYLADPFHHTLDVMFARAVGRGRTAEADIAWGENIANQIMDQPEIKIVEPDNISKHNRLASPYILGIPLQAGERTLGVFVLIRFGGPPFSQSYIQLAQFIAQQISLLVERQNLQKAYALLETQSKESRVQEDFISTITHELRTPLGFIKGYTTTLLRSDTQWDMQTQQEFLKIIDQETDRLQELIENLLDSARLQSGTLKMIFQPVRLDSLVRSTIEHIKMHHPAFTAHVDVESHLPPIEADPKRINQVLENLFNNAIKYAPGSDVWVKIKEQDGEAVLLIEDHGPGIPQRYLPYVFERFFRNPDTSPNVHGTGLGLFICKKIIQAHHGNIQVRSIPGKGTTFIIQLPLYQPKDGDFGELSEEI